jgi:D-glycero-D-manno-heptose 1,7-bisphosphate phosphatase
MTNKKALNTITTLFIDRDGVINQDSPDYIKSCEEFFFIKGSTEAFKLLEQNNIDAFVITNQSVIGRNMVSPEGLDMIFSKMKTEIVRYGGKIKDIFFCPHTPEDGCQCRKPLPGMIFQARDKYAIDLKKSAMIGDSAKDIECAFNAGVRTKILVKTGNGEKALEKLKQKNIKPDYIALNLLDGVQWLLKT